MKKKILIAFLGLLILGLTNSFSVLNQSNSNIFAPLTIESNQSPKISTVPDGIIGIWTGTLATIPQGWILCDGNGGTINMTDRFPYGTDKIENAGYFTGTSITTQNHSYTQIPEHNHAVNDPQHRHEFSVAELIIDIDPGYMLNSIPGVVNQQIVLNETTGISLENNGSVVCYTENSSYLPPYYEVAFIKKGPTAPNWIPQGVIFLWNDTIASIPQGWILCNGISGTPNLIDQFLRGVATNENPGKKGGNLSHKHTYSQVPSHTHTITDLSHGHSYGIDQTTSVSGGSDGYGAVLGSIFFTSIDYTGITVGLSGTKIATTQNVTALPPYTTTAYIMATVNQTSTPKGIIAMWSSTWVTIPESWSNCNGTMGTPDLSLQFPRSIAIGQNPGIIGGNTTHQHPYSILPQHNHDVIDPGHSHQLYSQSVGVWFDPGTSYIATYPFNAGIAIQNVAFTYSYVQVDLFGDQNCQTDLMNHIPPYCKVIFIQHLNTPPTASDLQLTVNPTTDTDLVGNYVYFDTEMNPELGTQIFWYKNGEVQIAFNNQLTVPNVWTNLTEEWYFMVIPNDGMDTGLIYESIHRFINDFPILSQPPDQTIIVATANNIITWTVTDTLVGTPRYSIFINDTMVINDGTWASGIDITFSFPNDRAIGHYNVTIQVSDGFGGWAEDSVLITIVKRPLNLWLIGGFTSVGVIGLAIVILLIRKKKKQISHHSTQNK